MSFTQALSQLKNSNKKPAKRLEVLFNRVGAAIEDRNKSMTPEETPVTRTQLEVVRTWVGKGRYFPVSHY